MTEDWVVGMFTLGGTLGGTALGGVISYRIHEVAENRRDAREAETAQMAMLAAKRQVASEIQSIVVALRAIAEGDEEAEAFRHLLKRRERWDKFGPVLADDDTYVTVNAAYDTAEMLERNFKTLDIDRLRSEASDVLIATLRAFDVLDPERRLRDALGAVAHGTVGHVRSGPH